MGAFRKLICNNNLLSLKIVVDLHLRKSADHLQISFFFFLFVFYAMICAQKRFHLRTSFAIKCARVLLPLASVKHRCSLLTTGRWA